MTFSRENNPFIGLTPDKLAEMDPFAKAGLRKQLEDAALPADFAAMAYHDQEAMNASDSFDILATQIVDHGLEVGDIDGDLLRQQLDAMGHAGVSEIARLKKLVVGITGVDAIRMSNAATFYVQTLFSPSGEPDS